MPKEIHAGDAVHVMMTQAGPEGCRESKFACCLVLMCRTAIQGCMLVHACSPFRLSCIEAAVIEVWSQSWKVHVYIMHPAKLFEVLAFFRDHPKVSGRGFTK